MKTIFVKIVEHPLSLAVLLFAVMATADFAVCAVERAKLDHSIKKNKMYPGSEYNGLIIKQKLSKYTPTKK